MLALYETPDDSKGRLNPLPTSSIKHTISFGVTLITLSPLPGEQMSLSTGKLPQ